MTDNKKTETESYKLFGLTKEEQEKLKDFKPTLNLSKLAVNESVDIQVLDEAPREAETKDDKGEPKKELIVEAIDLRNGLQVTVWLSSKSLRMEFLKAYNKLGTLKNKKLRIGVREYEHPKYKTVKAYTAQVLD